MLIIFQMEWREKLSQLKETPCAHLCKFDLKRLYFSPLSATKVCDGCSWNSRVLLDPPLCVKESWETHAHRHTQSVLLPQFWINHLISSEMNTKLSSSLSSSFSDYTSLHFRMEFTISIISFYLDRALIRFRFVDHLHVHLLHGPEPSLSLKASIMYPITRALVNSEKPPTALML